MNNLQIFENEEFGPVRTVTIDGEPWLVGKDVALALGYKNPQEAIREHVDEEDKGVSEILTPGGRQKMPIINESGLYSLIFGSKLETAKRFKHWVTSEVLPALRKTGHYGTPQYKQQTQQRDLTKDDYIRAASIISGCRNERLPYV
ncbi:MAG: Bro-N domain-containing protein, partial [Lachnospiraceae bacterium]|nr:Bro-N domain-containing protein [Lachnospiraceae bacterium]